MGLWKGSLGQAKQCRAKEREEQVGYGMWIWGIFGSLSVLADPNIFITKCLTDFTC